MATASQKHGSAYSDQLSLVNEGVDDSDAVDGRCSWPACHPLLKEQGRVHEDPGARNLV